MNSFLVNLQLVCEIKKYEIINWIYLSTKICSYISADCYVTQALSCLVVGANDHDGFGTENAPESPRTNGCGSRENARSRFGWGFGGCVAPRRREVGVG